MKKKGLKSSEIPGVTLETRRIEGGRARYQVAKCSGCGNKLWLRNATQTALPEAVIFKKLRQNAWEPHKRGKHICDKCLAAAPKPTTPTQEETVPMPKDLTPEPGTMRVHEMTEPLFLLELIDRLGTAGAAAELHFSESGIKDMITRGECRYVTEMAAELIVERLDAEAAPETPEAPKPALVIASVKREDLDVVQRILGGLGVTLSEVSVPQ